RDADAGGVDVRVQVDQARYDELARGVHHAVGARGRDVGFERLDHAVAHADVAPGAQVLAGVEHFAALDDEVEFVVRAHRRAGGRADQAGGECCADAGDELPAL